MWCVRACACACMRVRACAVGMEGRPVGRVAVDGGETGGAARIRTKWPTRMHI